MKRAKLSFVGSSFPIKILYDIFTQTNIYLENVERFFLRNLLFKADSYNDRLDLTHLHCDHLNPALQDSYQGKERKFLWKICATLSSL